MTERTGEIRPFFQTLQELRGGECVADLGFALNEVVRGVRETDKAGELVLKIKIRPATKNSGGAMIVQDEVIAKAPTPDVEPSFFFSTVDNNLQRNNPNQPSLDLRPVVDRPADGDQAKA